MSLIKNYLRKIKKKLKTTEKVPVVREVPESKLLNGKVALITGGSGGIGMEIAKTFLKAGAKVIIAGTNEKKLKDCEKTLGEPERVRSIQLNVKDVGSFQNKVNEAVNLFDDNRLDILVNAAGIVAKAQFLDMTEEEYDNVMDINAKGTFFMCQTVIKYMTQNNIKGHILNFSSSSALRPAWTPYHMSKWAVRGLTVGLADMFVSKGIIINAIGPGPTATEMLGKKNSDEITHPTNPSGRYAMPEEVANVALLLVSGAGDYIVGDTVYITGGSGITSYHD